MTINEFLQKYRDVNEIGFNKTRPRAKCADGFTVSVQAGRYIYSDPREDASYYNEVELGFPSCKDDLIMPYAEDPDIPIKTVYAYVPVEVVDELFEKHGGLIGADFSNMGTADVWNRLMVEGQI